MSIGKYMLMHTQNKIQKKTHLYQQTNKKQKIELKIQ